MQFQTRAIRFDEMVSGFEMDRRLVVHLIDSLPANIRQQVLSSPKAIEKVFREARKSKEILSANRDTRVLVIV